jgi:hypothetical protein
MVWRRWLALAVTAWSVIAAVACGQQGAAPGGEGDGDAASAADAPRGGDATYEGGVANDGAGELDVDGGIHAGEAGSGGEGGDGGDRDGTPSSDAAPGDAGAHDGAAGDGSGNDGGPSDGASGDGPSGDSEAGDTGSADAGASDTGAADTGPADSGAGTGEGGAGIITGGPCLSGAAGATAYRVRWVDAGGTAQVLYEVDGLPDKSRDQTGAYGNQIGFTPSFVDPFLGAGGLQLDSSDFVDVEISTVGVSSIASASLSVYGRSYSVDTNGSFAWQTFDGTGQTATDFVSNVAPYQWYSADITGDILPGESGVLLRITAGPSSGALVVNRIELCFVAQ